MSHRPRADASSSRLCAVFIAGTDTGIGKTLVSTTLLKALNATGLRAVGMKPVASGCETTPAGVRNDDALQLLAESAGEPDYATLNAYALRDPIAPHLAAADAGIEICLDPILAAFSALSASADCVVVATDHTAYDWETIAARSRLIVDTRNALRTVRTPRAEIVKL